MSDNESQASLSQISLISCKEKHCLQKKSKLQLLQISYGRSALIFYFILIFYKYIGVLAIFSSIVQHIWLYFAHIAQLYYILAEFTIEGRMQQSSVPILTCVIRPGVWEI